MRPMKLVIADTSAIIAYLKFEPGADLVNKHLSHIRLSTVNLAEAIAVLSRQGIEKSWIETRLFRVFYDHVPFESEQAYLCGILEPITRPKGLSLGDRACLSAGLLLGCPVLTAESSWTEVDWTTAGYYPKIELIR
jgi:PIN domain nuclease of toxin-antitoxin system